MREFCELFKWFLPFFIAGIMQNNFAIAQEAEEKIPENIYLRIIESQSINRQLVDLQEKQKIIPESLVALEGFKSHISNLKVDSGIASVIIADIEGLSESNIGDRSVLFGIFRKVSALSRTASINFDEYIDESKDELRALGPMSNTEQLITRIVSGANKPVELAAEVTSFNKSKAEFDQKIQLLNEKCFRLIGTFATSNGNENIAGSIQNCKTALNQDSVNFFDSRVGKYNATLDMMASYVDQFIAALKNEEKNNAEKLISLRNRIEALEDIGTNRVVSEKQADTVIHPSALNLIYYTLLAWAFILSTVIIAIVFLNYLNRGDKSKGNSINMRNDGFSYMLFLEMVTVFVLTVTILILGIAQKINPEGLAALIGGISGYVLGRMSNKPEPRTT